MASAEAAQTSRGKRVVRSGRAVRGLIGVFVLTILNLAGVFFALTALGGLEPWTGWQFIGLFGFLEASTALALLVAPNAWRLPVDAAEDPDVVLSRRQLLVPRWGALAKLAAGLLLLSAAATQTGLGAGIVLVPVLAVSIALVIVAISLGTARWGVARPHLDVCQITVRRPGCNEWVLPGISVSAAFMQFLVNITVLPVVKIAPPSILFRPELGTSPSVALAALLAAFAAAGLAYLAWRSRLDWNAPPAAVPDEEPADLI